MKHLYCVLETLAVGGRRQTIVVKDHHHDVHIAHTLNLLSLAEPQLLCERQVRLGKECVSLGRELVHELDHDIRCRARACVSEGSNMSSIGGVHVHEQVWVHTDEPVEMKERVSAQLSIIFLLVLTSLRCVAGVADGEGCGSRFS